MTRHLSIAMLAVCTLFVPAVCFGSAIEFTSAPVAHDSQLSLGFEFTTNQDLQITSLGYFDENQDGFLTGHEVGIFDSAGNLLVSTILAPGTGSSLVGHYRYNSIDPIILAAGNSFVIAGTTGGYADGWAYGRAGTTIEGFVVDPAITVALDAGRFVYHEGHQLRMPTDSFGYTIYGGPNFLGNAVDAAVPEPASATLMLSGVAGLLLLLRRKRRSNSQ